VTRLFGTDGIRGVANKPPMTPETALAVGRAVVRLCWEKNGRRPRIVVGRDTRLSGIMLESAFAAGVCSAGGDVLRVGILPTPGVAFALKAVEAAAGVVISASHNPFQDNGIKIFAADGLKLSDDDERRIEALIAGDDSEGPLPGGSEVGTVDELQGAVAHYTAFCRGSFPADDLAGLQLVLDCANGATSWVAPDVFSAVGAQVTVINNEPTGANINKDCGSEHTEGLSSKVREIGAAVGLAFDGDGDRLIAVDEDGRRLTGDQVIAVCAQMYKDRGWLDKLVVVTTVMSNLGLSRALTGMGVEHVASQVGDRHVVKLMNEVDAAVGGEESGHIIFRRHHTTGDGIVAGLQLLAAMRFYGRPLSELAGVMTVMPQTTINVDVVCKPSLEEIPRLPEAIGEAERLLGDEGRILVRYSGTQSMCRVMVEGSDSEVIRDIAGRLADIICREIGAQ
jgi:phosphoglucosamine mutase